MYRFSLVIPIYNEEDNIIDLLNEICNDLANKLKFEIIIINDGSTDNTSQKLSQFNRANIKVINNKKNLGQSRSIHLGISNSSTDTIVTIDGDGQNIPKDILKLTKIYFEREEIKLVSGIRIRRKDSIIKLVSSRIANLIRNLILRDNCKDTGCSLKIFDKNIFLSFPFFDGIHRFIPAFYVRNNYIVSYVNVGHRPRMKGKSKYGTKDRLTKGLIDLMRVRKILNKDA